MNRISQWLTARFGPRRVPLGNVPPRHGIRVPAPVLQEWVAALLARAGMHAEDAALIADLLTQSDLRCVFSHGSRQAPRYVRELLRGEVNPAPQVRVEGTDGVVSFVDGDGGLGYAPAWLATRLAIARTKDQGVGVAVTRNHSHFGSAGHYSRQALPHGCLGLAISGHRHTWTRKDFVWSAIGNPPLSLAIPAGDQPAFVLDMGAELLGRNRGLCERFPRVFLKNLGLGSAFIMLGGILAGVFRREIRDSKWSTTDGSFIAAVDIKRFMPLAEFRREMDEFIAAVRDAQPLPGFSRTDLAGGIEQHREAESLRLGIPLGAEHRAQLEQAAAEVGLESPFSKYEPTAF